MKSYLLDLMNEYPTSWESILEEKKVKVKREGNLAIFNYDILADFTDDIVRESRGIIIDMDAKKVVCYPFIKFCNYGEAGADDIDWKTARVEEKVDGSIIKVWYYGGEWHVSTNGVIDARNADISISTKEFHTFYDVFAAAASNVGLDYNKLDKNKTYIFELVSPANRIVVNYNGAITLYHIGTRDMITGLEEEADIGVPKPKTYPIHTLQDCLTAAAALNEGHEDIIAEGFVVKDANYHRIKIKDPKYVAVHRILPNGYIDDIKILELVKFGDLDELLTYIPSLEKRIKDMEHAYKMTKASIGLNYKVDKMYVEDNHISRKEYALKRKDDAIFSILIKSIYDNVDPIELFEKMSTKKQMDIIKRIERI